MDELLLIAIDSSVFIHVLNTDRNKERHIERLLLRLQIQHLLCVDEKVIPHEYRAKVEQCIRNQDQEADEIAAIRFWLDPNSHYLVPIDKNGPVYKLVFKIIKRRVPN